MKPGFREETKIEICDRLLSVVESVYRLDLKTKSRDRRFVSARISYSMILRDLNFGYSYIGSVIGKHHSTIIYYCNFFDSYKRSDRIFKEMHEEILYKFQKNDVTIFDIKQLDLEKQINILNLRIKELDLHNSNLELELENLKEYNKKNEIIHRLVNHKVKPEKEKEVELKLKRILNGL